MRKLAKTIIATLAAGLSLAVLAASPAGAVVHEGSGHGEISGHGVLWATGTGTVDVDAEYVRLQMEVTGDVTISGSSDLRVKVNGDRVEPLTQGSGTTVVLDDFDGTVMVSGTDVELHADGESRMRGRGTGEVTLDGSGRWRTQHSRGFWSINAEPLVFGPAGS